MSPTSVDLAKKVVREARRRALAPRWGNLRRQQPFSDEFGFDRGTPIDRHYIEAYLSEQRSSVTGRVLEVTTGDYARRFGRNVQSVDVLDVDPSNPDATIVGDLAELGSLPAAAFDCFICTQTLQYVSDVGSAIENARRALVPGGVLLLTVPSIAKIDSDFADLELRRLLPAGVRAELLRRFDDVEVEGRGNLVAAIAFLHGIATEELSPKHLAAVDSLFPVVTVARAVAPG